MRTSERHHLKENELANALGQAGQFATRNRSRLTAATVTVAVLAVAAAGYFLWQRGVESRAQGMLAQAMVVEEARVMAPAPAAEGAPPTQQPGTYPTEQARFEAALPKYLATADAYPASSAGQMSRYHAGVVLVALGRFDEAIKQYDQVANAGGLIGQSARLGKAEAELRAGKYDAAIAAFKAISEQTTTDLPKEAVLLELARAYQLAGKTDEARKTLNQIVDQHADSPLVAEAKKELEKIKG